MAKDTTLKETEKARLVLQYATRAKDALRQQCDASRQARRATGGALTDQEQDLLRAMLVFAAAGLDSLMKQLIRDSIHNLAGRDPGVQAELETFVARQLRAEPGEVGSDASSGRKFLARVLAAPAPLTRITEDYVRDLTGESLQSAEQVFRAAKALGVQPNALGAASKDLKETFEARNQIIHEMDIRLEAKTKTSRKRRSRTIDDLTGKADGLLEVGSKLIEEVERKLKS